MVTTIIARSLSSGASLMSETAWGLILDGVIVAVISGSRSDYERVNRTIPRSLIYLLYSPFYASISFQVNIPRKSSSHGKHGRITALQRLCNRHPTCGNPQRPRRNPPRPTHLHRRAAVRHSQSHHRHHPRCLWLGTTEQPRACGQLRREGQFPRIPPRFHGRSVAHLPVNECGAY